MSLERVIAEQQKEIDSLKDLVKSQQNQLVLTNKQIEKRFLQLDNLVNLRLRDCWRDDKKEQWDSYCKGIYETRLTMIEYGWCFNCQSFNCECEVEL